MLDATTVCWLGAFRPIEGFDDNPYLGFEPRAGLLLLTEPTYEVRPTELASATG